MSIFGSKIDAVDLEMTLATENSEICVGNGNQNSSRLGKKCALF
jgi:hypothetical protein